MAPEEKAARKAEAREWMRRWLEEIDRENKARAAKREADAQRRLAEVEAEKVSLPAPPPRRMKIEIKAR